MGEWEGNTISFIEDKYPKEYYSFWNTPHLYKSQKGESFDELRNRVMNVLSKIQEELYFRKYTDCYSYYNIVLEGDLSHECKEREVLNDD